MEKDGLDFMESRGVVYVGFGQKGEKKERESTPTESRQENEKKERELTPTESNLLDRLKEKLLKNGYTKAQADSKVVWGVLSIIANDNSYIDIARARTVLDGMRREIASYSNDVSQLKAVVYRAEKQLEDLNKKVREQNAEVHGILKSEYKIDIEYVKKFLDALENCETPEARDSMRVAQAYMNAVSVVTKYDNTAFIIGLSAILANYNTWPIDELKKINKKIPSADFEKVFEAQEWGWGSVRERIVAKTSKIKRY